MFFGFSAYVHLLIKILKISLVCLISISDIHSEVFFHFSVYNMIKIEFRITYPLVSHFSIFIFTYRFVMNSDFFVKLFDFIKQFFRNKFSGIIFFYKTQTFIKFYNPIISTIPYFRNRFFFERLISICYIFFYIFPVFRLLCKIFLFYISSTFNKSLYPFCRLIPV